jgi:hypothetical protein
LLRFSSFFGWTSLGRKTALSRALPFAIPKKTRQPKAQPMPIAWLQVLPLNSMICGCRADAGGDSLGRIAQDQGYMHKNYADWKRRWIACAVETVFDVPRNRQTPIGESPCSSF